MEDVDAENQSPDPPDRVRPLYILFDTQEKSNSRQQRLINVYLLL